MKKCNFDKACVCVLMFLFFKVLDGANKIKPQNDFCPTEKTRFLTLKLVPFGLPGKGWRDVPEELEIRPSTIPKAGYGVFAKTFIRKYTYLGLYEGAVRPVCRGRDPVREYQKRKYEEERAVKKNFTPQNHCKSKTMKTLIEEMYFNKYVRPILQREHMYTWSTFDGRLMIDSWDLETASWARYVNCAPSGKKLNTNVASCRNVVYYVASKDIYPGQELLCYYGHEYARQLGIDPREFFDHKTRTVAGYFL